MSARTKLTVLHVDEGNDWRGGQQQIGLLVREQSRAGHLPVVLCPDASPLETPLREIGVRCVTFAAGHRRVARIARGIAALRQAVRDLRPDVIHAHNPSAHTMMHLAVRGGGRPLRVVTRRLARVSRGTWSRRKYRHGADVLIAVSAAVQRDLVASGAPPERIFVARSAVDPGRYAQPPSRTEALQALGLPHDARVVGSLGSLVRQKAHVDLIDAFARLSGDTALYLVIVGEGPLRSVLEHRARQRGIAGRFRLAGFRTDLERLVPHMDVMAFPSLYEGMPNAVLDALAAGVPVVATPAGGTPEVIDSGVGGRLVPFHSPGRLAVAIAGLLANRDLAGRLAAAGRQRVLAGHVPRVMAAATESAYLAGLDGRFSRTVRQRWAGVQVAGASPEIVPDLARIGRGSGRLPGGGGRRASPGVSGRGTVDRVELAGRAAILKQHRRGGLPGLVLRPWGDDLWLGTARVRREYRAGALGRARGAPFPAPLGWLAIRAGLLWRLYSSSAMVEAADRPGAPAPGWGPSTAPGGALLEATGIAVARQHHAGVCHGDLNIGNLLPEGEHGPIRIIDLSSARCRVRLRAGRRARDLARLERSALKAMGPQAPSRRQRLRLLAAYLRERGFLEELPDRRASRRALLRALRRRRALLVLHGVRG